MGQAVTLARWIGNGRRPVTAGRVLRKADVPAAGAALRVDVPARLRTMADIRELHRPWCAAVATGLLQVSDGSVTVGPALEYWPPDDGDLLAGWLAGLRAVCAAESYPQDEDSVRLLLLALLAVLGEDGAPVVGGLWQPLFEALLVLCDRYDKWSWEPLEAAGRYGDPDSGKPLAGLVAQLKVALSYVRPPIWRRVLLPATATLGDLHEVIQVLFGWDGDHLHVFESGKKRYADPFVNLEGTGDEEAVRIRDAMTAGATLAYTYDFGACWEHEITLEKTVPRDHSQVYPVCVEFRGDSPVEYWCEEEPEEPAPFGIKEVNRRLAAPGREPA
jgi:Plasmid pRiA4b ORF-3-like protein